MTQQWQWHNDTNEQIWQNDTPVTYYTNSLLQNDNNNTTHVVSILILVLTKHCNDDRREMGAPMGRDDICHKHHKQRLYKIITTRVKFYFVDVF